MSAEKGTRIGGAGGFWGDQTMAPIQLLEEGDLQYLTMDYLSEVTMSIMHKQLKRNKKAGWATDLEDWLIAGGITLLHSSGVKLVTNAGGANPLSCASMVLAAAAKIGWNDCQIALVLGDDLSEKLGSFAEDGHQFKHMFDAEQGSLLDHSDAVISANAYLGAGPIGRSLERGADIVITGRVADASLIVGCLLHSNGWAKRAEQQDLPLCGPIADWHNGTKAQALDIIAGWTVAGHLIECGAQVSGGNSSDWMDLKNLENVGYPIAEIFSDGTSIISKPKHSSGAVTCRTVSEQLLYEIGDPTAYITPDCVVDLSNTTLQQVGANQVLVSASKGFEQTKTLKISASHKDGWMVAAELLVPGPNARKKAEHVDEILRSRLMHLRKMDIHAEFLGAQALTPPGLRNMMLEPSEIVIRWTATSENKNDLSEFSRSIAPLVLTGPAGICGYSARTRPREILRFFPTILERNLIEQHVQIKQIQSRRHQMESKRPWLGEWVFDPLENIVETNKGRIKTRVAGRILDKLSKPEEVREHG